MNDFLFFKNMLENKVKHQIILSDEKINHYKKLYPKTDKAIKVYNSPKFGYPNFLSIWLFDVNGNFITVGPYE